jgi:hypothetical protein
LLAQRRFFTVFALLLAFAVLVSGCQPANATEAPPPTLVPTDTPAPTATASIEPTITITPSITESPTDMPTSTETSTDTLTPVPCLKLIFPENGSDLPKEGLISFLWDEQPGASSYLLEIIPPAGKMVTFTTQFTLRNQYAEALPWGGEHKWQVVALDANGKAICTSQTFTFTKPVPPVVITWTVTPQPGELQATVPTKTSTPRTLTPQPSQ